MILRRLVEYADTRMDLPPPMYGETPVRWTIRLKPGGELEGFVRLGGDDKATRRGMNLLAPTIVRAAGIKPKLLVDNGEYVLGVGREGADPKQVADRHRQFVELTRRCVSKKGEPDVRAVVDFLEAWDAGEHEGRLPEDFDPQDNVAFRVSGREPTESQSVKDFWAASTAGGGASEMMCLVTGRVGPVEQRLPVKVKGLTGIGGQASGTSLISANKEPFESYGLENSLTSPISRDAGERFGKALNHLLADQKSRVFIGPSAYVFWTREESAFDPILMVKPDAESVRLLFQSPVSGRERSEVGANDFYALALSASGGRAVVRDWLETTVLAAEENLRNWFRAQRMVSTRGEAADPLGLYALAASAYRDAGKEMTPQIPAALVRAAIKGGGLPED
nr:type I-C CRISPR-associated protein Cas8c/Csd1 [Rubrobacter sp.]